MTPKKLLSIQFFALIVLLSIPALQASAQSAFTQSRITQAVDENKLTLLKGNVYPLARPEFDRGPAPSSLPMENMLLVLKRSPEQEAALDKLMAEQLDKSSPNFHKWLTPEQFGQQFGPSDQDIQTITSWLGSHGFQVVQVTNGRTVINFSGNAGQVQQAFHTSIDSYVVKGEQHWANSSDPQIPTALAPVVAGVNTLHNFHAKAAHVHAGEFLKSKKTGKVTPVNSNFTYAGGCLGPATNCFGIGPTDFAIIYNVLPRWTANNDGTGVTIAVVGQTNINPQDNVDFRSIFGLPSSHLTITQNPNAGAPPIIGPGGNDDEAEADIDTQWSGAVAKGAAINYVMSASTNSSNGVDLSSTYIVDQNLAPIVSESYGACEFDLGTTGNLFYFQMWQQAAMQGMSVFIASGDQGSATCDAGNGVTIATHGLQVSGFASTPFNVSVGGTDFNDVGDPSQFFNVTNASPSQASALGYIPEVVWNNSCASSLWADIGGSTDPVTNCNNSQVEQEAAGVIGGGGGVSDCTSNNAPTPGACAGGYEKPPWQAGPGVPNDGKRDVPDVSLFSGNGFFNGSFYIVCQMDANVGSGSSTSSCNLTGTFADFQGFGGTSVATPAMAGVMALVIQQAGGTRQGNPNPVHYALAKVAANVCDSNGTQTASCIFHNLQTGAGNNAMPCTPGTPQCTASAGTVGVLPCCSTSAGFNLASGLGSLNVANFVTGFHAAVMGPDFSLSLPNPPAPPTPTTLNLAAGGTATTTITVTGANGYNGTISFSAASCGNLPAGTSCSFNPASVGPGNGTTTLTVTNMSSGMLAPIKPGTPDARTGAGRLMLLFLSFAILWLGIQAGRRRLRWSVVASLLLVGGLLGIAACGGGSSSTPPPPPPTATNQSVVITATDGTNTHSIYFLLNVQ